MATVTVCHLFVTIESIRDITMSADHHPLPPPPLPPPASQHTDLQVSLAKAEQSCFETKLKLDRESGDKRALLQENRSLEGDRDDLRLKLRQITEDKVQIQQRCVCLIQKASQDSTGGNGFM